MMQPLNLQNDLHTHFARYSIFLPKQILGMLAIVKVLFEECLIWFTRPVEVLFRHRFGVRGHSLFMTMQLTFVGVVGCGFGAKMLDPLLAVFSLASAGMAIYHYIEARRWERYSAPPRYSYSDGEPVARLWSLVRRVLQAFGLNANRLLTVPLICRFGEPLVCLLLSLAAVALSRPLGAFLCCCSVALLTKGHIVHMRIVNMQRDQIDARIVSHWLIGMQRKASGTGQGEQQCYMVRLAAQIPLQKVAEPDVQSSQDAAPVKLEYVRFKCANADCKKTFKVNKRHIGRVGRCRKCGTKVAVTA